MVLEQKFGLTETQKRRLRKKQNKAKNALLDKKPYPTVETNQKSKPESQPVSEMADKNLTQNKDDVKAQREAKKLMKQIAKAKKSDQPVDTTVITANPGEHQNLKPKNNKGIDEVDRAVKIQPSPLQNKNDTVKLENSMVSEGNVEDQIAREKVKAEREAKKLAKQLAKKKLTGTGSQEDSNKGKENASIDQTAIVKPSVHLQDQDKTQAKSNAVLKAERRAKQEAQRAAKEAAKAASKKVESVSKTRTDEKENIKKDQQQVAVKILEKVKAKSALHKVKLFQHLYTDEIETQTIRVPLNTKDLHPAILRLGVKMASRVVRGSNARCVALLYALKQVIRDYALPAKTDFARGLEPHLATCYSYLWTMRPLSASMTNAIKHLRWQISQLPNNINEFDAKSTLNDAIDTYIRDQIEVAGEAISIAVRNKISNGDNILTYGCSSLVEKILKEAWSSGLRFRTVVVGSRSNRDGVEMLRRLTAHKLPCTYINISAINYLMRSMDKVVLGAGALLGNGWVVSRAGTAQVALSAKSHNVPTLVCCETHKFSERVQTDAFVYNEIGNPDELIDCSNEKSPLKDWRSHGSLTPLNLEYDVTPPQLVTAIVTELAILPCTSAPVVLRYKFSEYGL